MRRARFITTTLLCLLACESAPIGVDGVALEVRAPREGTVIVGQVNARVSPLKPAQLRVEGDGPYTVTFTDGGDRLTVLQAPGPVVDLGALLGAQPVVRGTPEPLLLRPGELGATDAVAIVEGVRYTPVESGAGWRFELPQGRPVELVVLWRNRGVANKVGYRRLSSTAEAGGRTLVMLPSADVVSDLAVELPASPRGWVQVELTVSGVRTGLVLGGGVAGQREAVALPRPVSWPAGALWIQATARSAGVAVPLATAAVHVPASTQEVALRWRRVDDLAPQPTDATAALPLDRDGATLSWLAQTSAATYLELNLAGFGDCQSADWRVVFPAAPGQVRLPALTGGDPLALPLVAGRVTAVHIGGLDYAGLLAPGAPAPEQLPGRTARVDRRTASGFWRGARACDRNPRAGLYRLEGQCRPGEGDALALVDRCGTFIELDEVAGLCGTLRGNLLRNPLGGAWPVTGTGSGLDIDAGEDTLSFALEQTRGIATEAVLVGDWYRVELTEQRFQWVDGRLGPSVPDSPVANLGGGGPVDGPWLSVRADGRLTLATSRWQFDGVLTRFDGQRGDIRVLGSGCDTPQVSLHLTEDGALELISVRPTEEPDQVVRRRAILYR